METGHATPDSATDDKCRVEKMLAEYERAQDIAHHTDTVIEEITAIVWGANTLLLGFILEVGCDSDNQKLVIVAAVLGFLMSVYVPLAMRLTKTGQRIAYTICREIENELPLAHRLNNRIHEKYPKWKPGQIAVFVLTVFFVAAWVCVIGHARSCLHRRASVAHVAQLGQVLVWFPALAATRTKLCDLWPCSYEPDPVNSFTTCGT